MKKHSEYIEKKSDFIKKHDSLSDDLFSFYKEIFTAQEKAFGKLQDNSGGGLPVRNDNPPFLKPESINLSEEIISILKDLIDEISGIVVKTNPGMDFTALTDAFTDMAEESAVKLLSHDYDFFEKRATDMKLDISELLFMIHNTLKPLLVKWRVDAGLTADKEEWAEGRCPFCGYLPDFSKIIESKENMRKLHCSLCEEEWEFPRLKCHSCGTDEQESLGYYEFEDDAGYRVYYCDQCKSYIKSLSIPKLREDSGFDLAVEDVITGFLDSTMMSKGYSRD